jgi:hypothetical protein
MPLLLLSPSVESLLLPLNDIILVKKHLFGQAKVRTTLVRPYICDYTTSLVLPKIYLETVSDIYSTRH